MVEPEGIRLQRLSVAINTYVESISAETQEQLIAATKNLSKPKSHRYLL